MDDFDPEMMREFQENLNSLSSTMGGMSTAFEDLVTTIKTVAKAQDDSSKAFQNSMRNNASAIEDFTKTTTELERSKQEATKDVTEEEKRFATALKLGSISIANFSQALTSGVEGFSKYGTALKGIGDSTRALTDGMGPLAKAAGYAVDALSKLGAMALEQTDAQNRFVKDLNLMGGIMGGTSDELTNLARDAGFAAKDLDKLTPIIVGASNGLASFGAGTSDGMKKFLEVLALNNNNAVEAEMRRYGYTLEEANEQQAHYIQLQRTAGINLNAQNISAKDMQTQSLKYAKTLVELSELTGLKASQLKEEQNVIASDLRNKIRNIRDQNDIARIEKELAGDISDSRRAELTDRKDQITQELEVRQALAVDLAGLGPQFATKLMNIIGTGAFDENTKQLASMGFNAGELEKKFKGLTAGSDEYKEAVADVTGQFAGAVRRNVDKFGKSMELASNAAEIGAIVGVDGETTDRVIALGQEDEARKRRLSGEDDVQKSTRKGVDVQKDNAAALQVFERDVRTASDGLLDAVNPFNTSLGLATGATLALGTSAMAASMSLMKLSGTGGIGGMFGKMKGMFSGASMSGIGQGAKAAAGTGFKFAKGNMLKIGGGGLLAGGVSAYGALSEKDDKRKQADRDYFEKSEGVTDASDLQRLKDERDLTKSNANKVGNTKAAGGMGGALAGAGMGASAGAALGSVVPILGTAIGGVIGAAVGAGLGAWAGSELGEFAGAMLSDDELKAFEASDAEVLLMSDDEKKEWQKNYDQAVIANSKAETAAADQLAATARGYDQAKESELYDKDIIGNSEINLEMLKEMRDGTEITDAVLKDMLTGILADSDMSAGDTEIVQNELNKLVASEEEKKNKLAEKDESKEKSFAEMSLEELWVHYDEVAIKEKELADNNLQALDAASKVVEEVTGNANGALVGPVQPADEEKAIAIASADEEKAIAIASTVEKANKIGKEIELSSTKVAALIESPVIKDKVTAETKPMNEATKEFVAYVDSDEGKAEIAQNEKIRAERMAEINTSAEDQLLAKEGQYQEVLDTGQYKGKDASESVMGQAKQYLASIEETKTKRMAMEQFGLPNNPKVDIEPEAEEALSVEEFKQKQLAQNKTEPADMTEFEKQSLAMLGQQAKLLGDIKSTSSDSADSQLKIATYASV